MRIKGTVVAASILALLLVVTVLATSAPQQEKTDSAPQQEKTDSASQQEKTDYSGITLKGISFRSPPTDALFNALENDIAPSMGMKFEPQWYDFDDVAKKAILDAKAKAATWDIIGAGGGQLMVLYGAGAIQPLEPLIDKVGDRELLAWDDFIKPEIDFTLTDGNHWAFPNLYSAVLLIYRSDLLNSSVEKAAFKKRYGYDLQVPENYGQYLDITEFFTRKKGELLDGKALQDDFYGTVQSNKACMY
ncbi:MAG: extracellular solute-binding protein, partial [Planctomycetes bacterium]|nr:extracellular solute-binding protein [Planctomycetota bacterium]